VPELRHRKLRVQIDTVLIEGVASPGLRVTCKASKSLRKEPNRCELTVYNLSPEHRAALTKVKTPAVTVSAGYANESGGAPLLTQIFYGQVIHVKHEQRRSDGDIITTVSNTDSGGSAQKARVHQSFGKGAKSGDVLKVLVKALGVKPGNLSEVVRKLNAGKSASLYVDGCTVDGHAPDYITELCRSADLEWSIQDGVLQVLDVGKALAAKAIVLDRSQLLETPSITSKGLVEFTTFISQDIRPGRQVQIAHPFVTAIGRLEKCEYVFDSYENDWYVHGELSVPKAKGKK
jgi:hypothetical protein